MGQSALPAFEEWVDYCFTQGHIDFRGGSGDDDLVVHARQTRYLRIDPTRIVVYLSELFESPGLLADLYSDTQIAQAVWFLFGCGSGYLGVLRDASVPADLQVRCTRSVTKLYTELFDNVCGRRGTEPDADLRGLDVDGAVYMIWDMDYLEGNLLFPSNAPHLVEPTMEILERVLSACRTSACRISALHGIGHVYCAHRDRGDKRIAARVRGIVDVFLKRKDVPEWLRDYAACARDGCVQ